MGIQKSVLVCFKPLLARRVRLLHVPVSCGMRRRTYIDTPIAHEIVCDWAVHL